MNSICTKQSVLGRGSTLVLNSQSWGDRDKKGPEATAKWQKNELTLNSQWNRTNELENLNGTN